MIKKQILQTKALSVFICYADEDEDKDLCQEFKKHLASLQLSGTIAELHDQSTIQPGQEQEGTILSYLDQANVIFLLVSASFMSSLSCMKQARYAMEKCSENSSVIPILIRQVLLDGEVFADLQFLPVGGQAVKDYGDRDKAWTDITRSVKEVMKVLSPPLPGQEQVSLDRCLQEGEVFFTNGQYEDGLKTYEQVIQMKPNLAVAHSYKGQILYKLGRYEDAIHACEQAIQLGSQLPSSYDSQGLAYYRLGLYQEASNAFDVAIKLAPDLALTYDHKARVLCRLKKPEKALDYCKQALKQDTNLASAYDNQGWALYHLQRYEEALGSCEKAIHLDSHLATAYYNKGRILYMLKRDQEALETYEQAITCYTRMTKKNNETIHLFRSLASVYRNKCKAYIKLYDYEKTIEAYDQAIEAYDQAIEAHKQPTKSSRYACTITFYKRMLKEAQQERAEVYVHKGEVFLKHNLPKEALCLFETAIELYDEVMRSGAKDYEKLAIVYANRGSAHLKLKHYKQALDDCNEAIRYNSKLSIAHSTRAEILDKRHRQ